VTKEKGYRKLNIEKLEAGHLYAKDLLKVILSNGFYGRDFTELAERLTAIFPSVRAILEASYEELICIDGMTRPVAEYLILLGKIKERLNVQITEIHSTEEFIKTAGERFKGSYCERVEFYLVSKRGKVLDIVFYESGLADKVTFGLQEAAAKIIASRCYGFYMVHNHPHTEAVPSREDDDCTLRLICACPKSPKFLDHCIVGIHGTGYSYRQSGKLAEYEAIRDNM